jgi:cell division protease FtsH
MTTFIPGFQSDFADLMRAAVTAGGFADPVAFDPDEYQKPILDAAVRGRFFPIGDTFIREWDRGWPNRWPGMNFGVRLYHLAGITLARVCASGALDKSCTGYDFFVVDRSQYAQLFRLASKLKRERTPQSDPPVMPESHRSSMWQNTIGFLEPMNLTRIREYGGRAKRGLLLTGPPGNGKTSACRWIHAEAVRRGWEARIVGPDEYQSARRDACDAAEEVRNLFKVDGPGVVFFDDMDIALRNRDTTKETDDQAVFLAALDGIEVNTGVVYVFTTNCPMELIDPAFRRPGRIDLTLHFPKPDAALRRKLIDRWHADIRAALELDRVLSDTTGLSYAEVEELKNLLVLRFVDGHGWDWDWAMTQFRTNRLELASPGANRTVGFAALTNGKH